jgi:crotonobetainyl-CoA:carnitine CoA-transferase CaiB-like acyl-CoA transferase
MSCQVARNAPDPLLADVKVLDVSPLLPGPFSSQMLADLGADVIRVEPPGGDFTRSSPTGMYAVANRNKRSLALDLHDEAHRRAFHAVAAKVDVVVEGFRPGVAKRLGIDYPQLRPLNERLIYCSISGFGQDGPERTTPGHDLIYLAAAGALDFSGHWNERGRRAGVPVSDLATSAYAAVAILAALHRRGDNGPGCYIDLAITDVAMALTSVRAGPQFDVPGVARRHLYPANDLFEAADGVRLAIAAVEQHFFDRLREVIASRDTRIRDSRFDDDEGRRRYGDELVELLANVVAREPSSVWLAELKAADIPVQPVLTAEEALAASRARERDVSFEFDVQRHVPFPARRDSQPMGGVRSAAPELGADTETVLRDAGLAPEEIQRIVASWDGG